MKNTKLIIISGATGSIGQEILKKYLVEHNTLIYGISRRGVSMNDHATLPDHHLMVNVNLYDPTSIQQFVAKIPVKPYESISYFHLVGEFKTEINKNLKIEIQNDLDGDGIDDKVFGLVAASYKVMVGSLQQISNTAKCEINIASFGSLADQHDIDCFSSFRRSREEVKRFSKECHEKNALSHFYLFSTSTILAADEMLERPYIFSTAVSPVYWITPHELVQRAVGFMELQKGYVEEDIYLSNPTFSNDYFSNDVTFKRRVKELFNK